jgi:SAM-dependent methyltransferase
MKLIDRIRANRAEISTAIGKGRYREFSAASLARLRISDRLIAEYARGRVLDVGCGHMPFRKHVLEVADSYEALDIVPRVEGVDYVTPVAEMTGVPQCAFDTALCFEVLEHVEDPLEATGAIAAVLRPGGILLVTAPHLSRLHEEPHDYFRYTVHGLRAILNRAGFETIGVTPYGGVATFIAHQISTGVVGLSFHIPGLRDIAYQLNRLLLVHPPLWFDRLLDRRHLMPLGYAVVARKVALHGESEGAH